MFKQKLAFADDDYDYIFDDSIKCLIIEDPAGESEKICLEIEQLKELQKLISQIMERISG